jgi:hypothetical protein
MTAAETIEVAIDVPFEIEIESIPTKMKPPRKTAHRKALVP